MQQTRPSTSGDLSKIDEFGKNEQVKKVFWTFFIGMAGQVLARVVDPLTAHEVVEIIMENISIINGMLLTPQVVGTAEHRYTKSIPRVRLYL